jgi:small subunit ribosomal protein S20
MPRIKSAKKALRQSEKRRGENLKKMNSLKSTIKGYKKELTGENKEALKNSLSGVYKALDKASKTNLIKKNKANRLKSRLAKKKEI